MLLIRDGRGGATRGGLCLGGGRTWRGFRA
jgi:hypothetical protein